MSRFLTVITLIFLAFSAQAQDKPRWAIKGANDLNEQRTNKTYTFVKFETFGGDLAQLRNESTKPLVEYLAKVFTLIDDETTVTDLTGHDTLERSLPNDPDATDGITRDYMVTFTGQHPATFYARLIDEYVSFDDNVDETYDYTLYQLFEVATSEGKTVPEWDAIGFTRSYNIDALVSSIIPGCGQWYKGQTTKAYCIWGGEAVCIAAALWTEKRRRQYAKERNYNLEIGKLDAWDSYKSKSQSWRVFRNIAIAGACGVYVYNLIDAAFSKGPRQVVVKGRASSASLAVAPTIVYDPTTVASPALALTLNF